MSEHPAPRRAPGRRLAPVLFATVLAVVLAVLLYTLLAPGSTGSTGIGVRVPVPTEGGASVLDNAANALENLDDR
ncbi:hypothetical protein KUV62_01765 [Salipiger bermudensis]|uniref:hypothetical protein n=1 Tax=Salipiger bermudensis TaxID=344736 RepID=UPI001C991FE9|nr:hypothetical protein [Salipiger bermudensis]MBY6002614.1 hypothetical protein [Salipiger bermudensis]